MHTDQYKFNNSYLLICSFHKEKRSYLLLIVKYIQPIDTYLVGIAYLFKSKELYDI